MQNVNIRLSFLEKFGYGLGDAASNFVWRAAMAYLAIFYTDVFGISAAAAALLLLITRLSDGVTDIVMGMIADRTRSRHGKFRPWVLWCAPLLGLFMVLCYTTPDFSPTGKLVWAYVTYIGLTLAYTMVNVPYSALMGVMTASETERINISAFRFAGAFGGGLLILGALTPMVELFGEGKEAVGYQYTMLIFAFLLIAFLVVTFYTTKERVVAVTDNNVPLKKELLDFTVNLPLFIVPFTALALFFYYRNIPTTILLLVVFAVAAVLLKSFLAKDRSQLSGTQRDMVDLVTNGPWLLLLLIGFTFMMFNAIKMGVIAYYFKYYIGDEKLAGLYFVLLLAGALVGAVCTGWLSRWMGRRNLFLVSMVLGGLTAAGIFWIPDTGIVPLFILGIASEFFAGIMPTLFFAMLGDTADYSEWKNNRRATGLIYSAGTFVNKTGGGFAGALVLAVLASYGYDGMVPETAAHSIEGMKWLMSWVPAGFVFFGALILLVYPLTDIKMAEIERDLTQRREAALASE